MLRRHHRDRLRRDVDAEAEQLFVDVGEVRLHELGFAVRNVEVDIIEPVTLDLAVDRARHDVARGELGALVSVGHEAVAGDRVLQDPALAAHCLGDQEILDLKVVEAGRVELHELHVGDAAPGAPRHRDPVPGRAARRGRVKIGAARAASGEDRRAGKQCLDPARAPVERIHAMDRARGRKFLSMSPGDEVDRDHVGDQGDIGVRDSGIFERLLDRPAGGVGDMDDAAVAVPTLARQMPAPFYGFGAIVIEVERHAQFGQPRDCGRRAADDMLDDRTVIEARAGDHRVADMGFEAVAFLEYGGDPALRPSSRAFAQPPLGDHPDLILGRQRQRRRQAGCARSDDQDVEFGQAASARVSARNTSSRSGSLVDTSMMPSPALASAASTSPALTLSLR